MNLGLGVAAGPDPDLLAPLAAEAASLGYVSIWSNDNPAGEALDQLRSWATSRGGIDLCAGVLALDRHQPEGIAQRVDDLDLPGDRLVLGLGAGHDSKPLSMVRFGVAEMRRLLPGVRLAVAAMGPMMCKLAGQVGDAALLNWVTPERAAWAREILISAAREVGKEQVEVYGYVRVASGEGARERLAREAEMYAQIPHYARHFEAMGADPTSVGIAAEDPAEIPERLAAYSALDVAVVRVLADREVESIVTVARHAVAAAAP